MAADLKENYIVGGYEFLTESDAQKASMDLSKIKLLEARAKVSRPNDIKAVYEKAIENKIFKTPIGWEYLRGLRKRLFEAGFTEEDLIPIPVEIPMTKRSAMDQLSARPRIKPEKKKSEFGRVFPIVLSILLFILVIVMFYIAATGENDNIINYKRNITNRYSGWEQELTERERAVRKAEKELGIESVSEYYNDTQGE